MHSGGPDIEMIAPAMIMFILIVGLISLAIQILFIVAFCKICSKAGYHWAMGLLMLVPIGNVILILILGFGQWPIHQRLQQAPGGLNADQGGYQQY